MQTPKAERYRRANARKATGLFPMTLLYLLML